MDVLVIGSGISGLSAAIRSAQLGCQVSLVSPYVSERSQSVMAAGGINAALDTLGEEDSPQLHFEETMKGGAMIEGAEAVRGLCESAPQTVRWLDSIGVVFSRDKNGEIAQRAFGGQSKKRTAYAGASTGKQIVTALTQKCREYEISGSVQRFCGLSFHSALIEGGRCYGAVFTDDVTGEIVPMQADAVIMATGGMNKLFGKTTGSELCDGYAAGRLMSQGVIMRNLEFIQYHPTTIETPNKRMLITEAARGEGGRLYYEEAGRRVYFMEEEFGPRGNLMPRDVVSRCIYNCPSQVYLDVSFLRDKLIHERLEEVYDLCMKYLDLDICRESIPVAPSVHFFMGGIRVSDDHETNIRTLYAVGECASKYHGANRLGGNSLLAAVYSGRVAAESCYTKIGKAALPTEEPPRAKDAAVPVGALRAVSEIRAALPAFAETVDAIRTELTEAKKHGAGGVISADAVRRELAQIMNRDLGIVREAEELADGIRAIEDLSRRVETIRYCGDATLYDYYRTRHMLLIARAILMSALAREESRGAHFRSDFPETKDNYFGCSTAEFKDGKIVIGFEETEGEGDS